MKMDKVVIKVEVEEVDDCGSPEGENEDDKTNAEKQNVNMLYELPVEFVCVKEERKDEAGANSHLHISVTRDDSEDDSSENNAVQPREEDDEFNREMENAISASESTKMKIHEDLFKPGNFQCEICGKSCNWKSSLITHMRTHSKKPEEASKNDKAPKTENSLPKDLKCTLCQKKFTKNDDLKRHLRYHINGKPFRCSYCPKRFSRSTDLNSHTMIHTGEKPYECSICARRFNKSGNLNQHIRVHSGEKRFECSLCNKRFNDKSGLTKHTRIHTGEKPYGCYVCFKRFRLSSHLTRHMGIHAVANT